MRLSTTNGFIQVLKHFFPYIFLIGISLPLILPYFHTGYFPSHDGEWAVVRLGDMYRQIRDGQIPARMSGNLNYGFGYPLFNFAYPMPYYLGLVPLLFKIGLINSIKFLFAISVPLSVIGMYILSKEVWKSTSGAIISSILYIYLPYRLVDLYVRGSLGESLSFVLFPFILFCFIKIQKEKSVHFLVLGGILYGLLIPMHNIMALLFSLTIGSFVLFTFFLKKYIPFLMMVGTILLGWILSAFFWLPALVEKNLILLSQIPIAERNLYYVTLQKFILPSWGYGVPTDVSSGFTYQLGLPQLVAIICVLMISTWMFLKKKNISFMKEAVFFLILFIMFILMLFPFTDIFWHLPLLKEINYPWTMLSQIGFLAALLAGMVGLYKPTRIVGFALCLTAILFFLPYARPEKYIDREDAYYLTNDATTTSSNELMPLWVKTFPSKRGIVKVETIKGKGDIMDIVSSSNMIRFRANLKQDGVVRIHTIYFPEWKFYANGNVLPVSYNNEYGLMDISLSKGSHVVTGTFSNTLIRSVGNIITLCGLGVILILGVLMILRRRGVVHL